MITFLGGSFVALSLVASLFFLRFYKKSHDRLFACFSLSFFMLAVERTVIILMHVTHEKGSEVYLIRLVSLLLILGAIIDKNRRGQRGY